MKYRNIIIFMAALAMLAAAIIVLSDNILSPYVPFGEAKSGPGSYVQVIGRLDRSVPVRHREGEFTFTVIDKEGTLMNVIHRGTKPQNFEHTDQIVLLGRYRREGDVFEAEKVLVKCPSKYRSRQ
jgi:cytochrome c-type biogenesis protein CcmE